MAVCHSVVSRIKLSHDLPRHGRSLLTALLPEGLPDTQDPESPNNSDDSSEVVDNDEPLQALRLCMKQIQKEGRRRTVKSMRAWSRALTEVRNTRKFFNRAPITTTLRGCPDRGWPPLCPMSTKTRYVFTAPVHGANCKTVDLTVWSFM